MDCCDGQKRREACRKSLPTDDHTAVLLLKPRQGPLGLDTRHSHLDGSAARFLGVPDALRSLRPDAAGAELLAEVLGIIPVVGDEDLRPFPRTSTRARPQVDRVP